MMLMMLIIISSSIKEVFIIHTYIIIIKQHVHTIIIFIL